MYALPPVKLLEAEFSSDTATAELVWTQYRGPNFAAYEVRRKVPGLDEEMVRELAEVSDTTYTDMLLDGNTEYTYHIVVRTGREGVGVSSSKLLLGALDESGVELWREPVESDGAFPVGLYHERDGDILMLGNQAVLCFFRAYTKTPFGLRPAASDVELRSPQSAYLGVNTPPSGALPTPLSLGLWPTKRISV